MMRFVRFAAAFVAMTAVLVLSTILIAGSIALPIAHFGLGRAIAAVIFFICGGGILAIAGTWIFSQLGIPKKTCDEASGFAIICVIVCSALMGVPAGLLGPEHFDTSRVADFGLYLMVAVILGMGFFIWKKTKPLFC